jgi:hypothetical protein
MKKEIKAVADRMEVYTYSMQGASNELIRKWAKEIKEALKKN